MPSSPPADLKTRPALQPPTNATNPPNVDANTPACVSGTIPVTAAHPISIPVVSTAIPAATHILHMVAAGASQPVNAVLSAFPKAANVCDDHGRTPLHVASAEGHSHLVAMLLRCGADPTALDMHGNTPVKEAARYGNINVLRTYAEHDVELPGTMLHQNLVPSVAPARALFDAAANGDKRAATVAVAAFGAHVNTTNSDGRTPLHMAVAAGHVGVAAYLISAGADPTIDDRWGNTPTSEALSSKNDMMRALFEGVSAVAKTTEEQNAAAMSEPGTIHRRVASLPRIVRAGSLPYNPISFSTTPTSTIASSSTSTSLASAAPLPAITARSSSEPTEIVTGRELTSEDNTTPANNINSNNGHNNIYNSNNNNNPNKRHSAPAPHYTNVPHESVAPLRSEAVELVPHNERTRLHFEVAQ